MCIGIVDQIAQSVVQIPLSGDVEHLLQLIDFRTEYFCAYSS